MQNLRPQCSNCPLGMAAAPVRCPFEPRQLRRGSLLEAQGSPVDRIHFVQSGMVLLEEVLPDGTVANCAVRGPGSLVGLDVLNDDAFAYSARAYGDAAVCSIGRDNFKRWVGNDRTPAGVVLQMAASEARARRVERATVARGAVERLASFLLDWMEPACSSSVRSLPRGVLARLLGLRAETFSRALRKLRDAGALAPGKDLVVADAEILGEIAAGADAPPMPRAQA